MDLHLDLQNAPGRSLRTRVENALREAVRDGRLAPGERLPATRTLCAELGVSRGVIVDAYAQLAAEGYLNTRRGGGTTVTANVAQAQPPARALTEPVAVRYDMNPFRPALDAFPRHAWSAAIAHVLRTTPDERLDYPDFAGVRELREALAAYLGRARGVRAHAEQVIVTNGLRQGMELLWSVLASQGAHRVGIEQPGWSGVNETAKAAGLRVTPLGMDADGVLVDKLSDLRLDAVAVAPAHQYPTGAVLSAERRAALLAWAREGGRLLMEDDYDAEYRYDRQPIGSLQGLASEHVVYGGSTSKTLAPAVRLGWIVSPPRLTPQLIELHRTRGNMPSPLLQLAFANMIERGEIDRHLRRQRRRYHQRRQALLEALATELPDLNIQGAAAGLYLVVQLPDHLDARSVLNIARARGIALESVEGPTPGLVLGYANLHQTIAQQAVAELTICIQEASSRTAI
jgi:GntR family transcriptional regulator / MocR family aminotransferase